MLCTMVMRNKMLSVVNVCKKPYNIMNVLNKTGKVSEIAAALKYRYVLC